MKKTFLVVGGAGYIGSHFLLSLADLDVELVVVDDLSTGSKDCLIDCIFIEGDKSDRVLLRRIFEEYNVSVVIDFSAFISIDESICNPIKYYNNNFIKTIVLLEEMIRANVKSFVFSSTAAVYNSPGKNINRVGDVCEPISPYGKSKIMVEKVLADFDKAYGLKYYAFRYFNVAGADPKSRIGFSETAQNLIPKVFYAISKNETFEIYGVNYDTRDGSCVRDYIHVNDIAHAHYLAIVAICKGSKSRVINLGASKGYSVKQIVNAVQEVTQKNIHVIERGPRQGDCAEIIAELPVSDEFFSWHPKSSSINKIILDSWNWVRATMLSRQ